jgi:hypothetical protein
MLTLFGCSTAWDIFQRGKQKIGERSESDYNDMFSALVHIRTCKACLLARVGLEKKGIARDNLWNFLLPLLAKATGFSQDEIFLDMPLGPLGVARIAIGIYKISKRPPHSCVDRPTVRKLLTQLGLWGGE